MQEAGPGRKLQGPGFLVTISIGRNEILVAGGSDERGASR